jgi:hypothetical protein
VLADAELRGDRRAEALCHFVGCMAQFGRKAELDRVLVEADRVCSADDGMDADTALLMRALLRVGISAHRRRHGDLTAAADAARTGLGFLDRLEKPDDDGGVVRIRLILQLACSLLDRGDAGMALEITEPLLAGPTRAAGVGPAGWLRLAIATRVHLTAGSGEAATTMLREAVYNTDRHGLHALTARLWLELAQLEERLGRPGEAIECLHRSRAAEHINARARRQAFGLLSGEFGSGEQAPVDLDEVLGGGARRVAPKLVRPIASEPAVVRAVPELQLAPALPAGLASRVAPAREPEPPRGQPSEPPQVQDPKPPRAQHPKPPRVQPAEPPTLLDLKPLRLPQPESLRLPQPEPAREPQPEPPKALDPRPSRVQHLQLPRLPQPESLRLPQPESLRLQQPEPSPEPQPEPPQAEIPELPRVAEVAPKMPEPASPRRETDDPQWRSRSQEVPAGRTTRHDSEHGSVAARSVLERLGISSGGGGGRRRASDEPVVASAGETKAEAAVTPAVVEPPAPAAVEPPPTPKRPETPKPPDTPVPPVLPVREDTPAKDEQPPVGGDREGVADPWLPRVRIPPSLEPMDQGFGWAVSEAYGGTPDLSQHFADSYARAIAEDVPAPDAGLAELLARALAEHQAGTANAAALVESLGPQRDGHGERRPVNGHRSGDGSDGRHRTGE